ncbi:uncharacterized protein [Penaeus vannamei]|uniref:uncharacterized protein n=1 Tax=Penaeus vannamei TaxID=6689 RepID=UPI00387FA45D
MASTHRKACIVTFAASCILKRIPILELIISLDLTKKENDCVPLASSNSSPSLSPTTGFPTGFLQQLAFLWASSNSSPSLSPTTGFPMGFLQQLSVTLFNNWFSYGLPPTALRHSLQQLAFLRASSNSSPSLSPTTGFSTDFHQQLSITLSNNWLSYGLPPTALRHSLQQLAFLWASSNSSPSLSPTTGFPTGFHQQLSVTLFNNWLSYGLLPTALHHSLQQLAFLRASTNSSPSLSPTTGFPMGFFQQLSVTLSNNWLSYGLPPTALRHSLQQLVFLWASSNSSPSLSPTTGFPMGFFQQLSITLSNNCLSYGLLPTALRHSLQQLAFLRASSNSSPSLSPTTGFPTGFFQQLSVTLSNNAFLRASSNSSPSLSSTTGFPTGFFQQLSITLSNNWLSYGLPPTALQQLAFLRASSNSSPSLSPTTGFPTGFLQQLSVTLSNNWLSYGLPPTALRHSLQQLAFLRASSNSSPSLSPTTGFPTGFLQQLSVTLSNNWLSYGLPPTALRHSLQQLVFLRASSNSSPSLSSTTGFPTGFLQQLFITLSNNWFSYGLPPTALRHSLQQLAFLRASSNSSPSLSPTTGFPTGFVQQLSMTLFNNWLSYGLPPTALHHSLQQLAFLRASSNSSPSLSPTTGFPTGFLQQLSVTLSNKWLSYGLPPTALHHSLQQLAFLRASSNSSPSLSPTTGFPTGFLQQLSITLSNNWLSYGLPPTALHHSLQ